MDTTPSTRYHPLPVRLFNRGAKALNVAGLARIKLSEPDLLKQAQRATGLDDFGDPAFLVPLRVLLGSLERESRLNPFGRMHAKTTIVESLKNRLWAQECFKANPEIRRQRIADPIIIVGPVRSGTTRLQRLLACDPRLQYLTAWEGFNPAPRHRLPELGKTARRQEVHKFLQTGHKLNPGAFAAHPMGTDEAEEEILLLNHTFCGLSASLLYDVPSRTNWLLKADMSTAYRELADMLKLIAWSRGEQGHKRWVLKTPQHMLDLPALMQTFPDAKLVFTHRDPVKTAASTMSLAWNFSVHNTDQPIRASVRDTCLMLCEEMGRRSISAREAIPQSQCIDVYYEAVNRDWRAEMRRIYSFTDKPWTAEIDSTMSDWVAHSARENRHGKHSYSCDDYHVTRDEIDDRMMFYRRKYGVPYENAATAL